MYQYIPNNKTIQVPQEVAVCPYCDASLTVIEIQGCTKDDKGDWVADSIAVECETERNLKGDELDWKCIQDSHLQMPYVYMLPVHQDIIAWMEKHYRFVDAAEEACPECGKVKRKGITCWYCASV